MIGYYFAEVLVLDRLVKRRHPPERLVVVGRIIGHQIAAVGVQRLAVQWHRIGEGPHDCAGLGVAEGCALVLDRNPLDTARKVGLPVGLSALQRHQSTRVPPASDHRPNQGPSASAS